MRFASACVCVVLRAVTGGRAEGSVFDFVMTGTTEFTQVGVAIL